jgi:hypothetical protein
MDDNIWEYPFGELDEDEDVLFHNHAKMKKETLLEEFPYQTGI